MSIEWQRDELKDFKEYLPLIQITSLSMVFDKRHSGFDSLRYWHNWFSVLRHGGDDEHDIVFTYSHN